MSSDRSEDCPTRMATGLGTGFVLGSFLGAVTASWSDVPLVLRDKPWPALVRTGTVMSRYGATLGMVGLAYATVDCFAETVRGQRDWKNGALAGLAGGALLGVRIGRLPVGVGAAAALAATSVVCDMSGHKLRKQPFVEDNATPARRLYPY